MKRLFDSMCNPMQRGVKKSRPSSGEQPVRWKLQIYCTWASKY